MDEFDGRVRRESAYSPLLVALFFGAVLGGGLGMQGHTLQTLAGQLRGVLDAPALGAPASAPPAPRWTPGEDAAQRSSDLESALTAPWPADRLIVPSGARAARAAAPIDYAVAARRAVLAAGGSSPINFAR